MEALLADLIRSNSTLKAQSLLESLPINFDINRQNFLGWTFLHMACHGNDCSTLPFLLSHPTINPNLPDFANRTPFTLACAMSQLCPNIDTSHCVSILLDDPRLDINCADVTGKTGLMWAAWNGRKDIVETILGSMRDIKMEEIDKAVDKAEQALNMYLTENSSRMDTYGMLVWYKMDPFMATKFVRRLHGLEGNE